MKLSITSATFSGLLIGMTISTSIQAVAQHGNMKPPHQMSGSKPHSPSIQMHEAMMAPMKNMGSMTGDPDRDFASMMAEHHKSAVEMAKLELKFGKNPELLKMCKNIIKSQSEEIQVLQKHAKMKH